MPMAFAAPKPRFVACGRRRTVGKLSRTQARVPSDEALSTRMTSNGTPRVASSAGRQRSRCLRQLKVTTTTETRGALAESATLFTAT